MISGLVVIPFKNRYPRVYLIHLKKKELWTSLVYGVIIGGNGRLNGEESGFNGKMIVWLCLSMNYKL